MNVEIKASFLTEGSDEGVFLQWLIQLGERVKKGDLLCEIETYKAVVQIEAPVDGVIADFKCNQGEIVTTSSVLGYIQTDDEGKNER